MTQYPTRPGDIDPEGWLVLPQSTRPIDLIVGSPRRRARPTQHQGAIELQVTPAMDSGPPQVLTLTVAQFTRVVRWLNGAGLVQDLLPDLTPEQREIVQTGLVL